MLVGVPAEVKNHEYRVAITPPGVHEFTARTLRGRRVRCRSGLVDHRSRIRRRRATIVPDPEDVWGKAELVLKVKEPIAVEYDRMREGQTLFTYLISPRIVIARARCWTLT